MRIKEIEMYRQGKDDMQRLMQTTLKAEKVKGKLKRKEWGS